MVNSTWCITMVVFIASERRSDRAHGARYANSSYVVCAMRTKIGNGINRVHGARYLKGWLRLRAP